MLGGCSKQPLPDYVVVNDPKCVNAHILRKKSADVTFSLSSEDQHIADQLEEKFDQEKNCAGLAAVQIGVLKRVIVFAVPDDHALKERRTDLLQTMPKTLWFNASYEPVGNEKVIDYEGCFSVNNIAGPVERHKTIKYKAFLKDGTVVEGTATGFLARVIQHEIDHTNGILCVDRMDPKEILTMSEYIERMKARQAHKQ